MSHGYERVAQGPGGGGPGGMMGAGGMMGGGPGGGMMGGGGMQGPGMMGGGAGGPPQGGMMGGGRASVGGFQTEGLQAAMTSFVPPHQAPAAGYASQPGQGFQAHGAGATFMNMFLFAAACCIMGSASICFLSILFTFKMVDLFYLGFLFIFGGVLAILDAPFNTIPKVRDMKFLIGKYVNVLTRVTGKGLTFLWLGASLLAISFASDHTVFFHTIALLTNLFVVLVGFAVVAIGWSKTQKLHRAQGHLRHGILENRYVEFSRTHGPQGGLTMSEFNALTKENGGFHWEDADLHMIFRALISNPTWRQPPGTGQGMARPDVQQAIPLDDLKLWVYGGMRWL